ncbi:MAG: xylanase [Lachnospiraceae bacterium]|nr:xylanase [Lachnospiraceae bacterium]
MKGSYITGKYPNFFEAAGYSSDDTERRIEEIFDTLFYGSDDERIYHAVGDDMAFIMDTGNIDARTEGMSYGMMMCVQLDRREEFDRIWKWAKTHMFLTDGPNKGFFCWSNAPCGSKNADGAAPDGEEYFAMALLFASSRWGDGEGIYEYSREACDILHEMIREGDETKGRGMFDPGNHLIRFICEADFTDPSYHLPHFYEIFSKRAYPQDRPFFGKAAEASRQYLHRACHDITGLCSEFAYFDGRAYEKGKDTWGRHDWYYSDAYRTIMNIALDHIWFDKDPWQEEEGERFLHFMCHTITESRWDKVIEVDGTVLDTDALHPVAVIATNAAAAALIGSSSPACPDAVTVLHKFWNTPLRTGKRRYYDNCLYFFSFLLLSGGYRIF